MGTKEWYKHRIPLIQMHSKVMLTYGYEGYLCTHSNAGFRAGADENGAKGVAGELTPSVGKKVKVHRPNCNVSQL